MKTLLFLICCAWGASAQGTVDKSEHQGQFKLFGKVFEYDPVNGGENVAADAQIVVYQGTELYVAFFTGKSGNYEFYLPVGHVYEIWYGGGAFVNKIVSVDATECPPSRSPKDLKLDMGLFRPIEGTDFPMLMEAFVKVNFDKENGMLMPDMEYVDERMRMLDKTLRKVSKSKVVLKKG